MKTKIAMTMSGFVLALAAALAVAMTGCPSSPPTSPQNDAADVYAPDAQILVEDASLLVLDAGSPDLTASPCTKACANLRTLGCPEGAPDAGESCEVVCKHTETGPFNLNPTCLQAAKTVAAVRACKTVTCLGAK